MAVGDLGDAGLVRLLAVHLGAHAEALGADLQQHPAQREQLLLGVEGVLGSFGSVLAVADLVVVDDAAGVLDAEEERVVGFQRGARVEDARAAALGEAVGDVGDALVLGDEAAAHRFDAVVAGEAQAVDVAHADMLAGDVLEDVGEQPVVGELLAERLQLVLELVPAVLRLGGGELVVDVLDDPPDAAVGPLEQAGASQFAVALVAQPVDVVGGLVRCSEEVAGDLGLAGPEALSERAYLCLHACCGCGGHAVSPFNTLTLALSQGERGLTELSPKRREESDAPPRAARFPPSRE